MTTVVRTLPTPISLNDFDVGVTLGTGSFGRVRFSTHKVLIPFSLYLFYIKRFFIIMMIMIMNGE
jgi:hypothetical protein